MRLALSIALLTGCTTDTAQHLYNLDLTLEPSAPVAGEQVVATVRVMAPRAWPRSRERWSE